MKCLLMMSFLALIFSPSKSWSGIAFSVSGASNSVNTGTTTEYYYSNIATGSVFAAGGACDHSINPNCKIPTDVISITVSANTTNMVAGAKIYAYATLITAPLSTTAPTVVTTAPGYLGTTGVYTSGTTVTFPNISYTTICTALGDATGCTTTDNTYVVINLVVADGSGTYTPGSAGQEATSFNLHFQSNIPAVTSPSLKLGIYDFIAYPGDAKIHIKSVSLADSFPTISPLTIQKAHYFYAPATSATLSTVLGAITYGSLSSDGNVSTTGDIDNRYIKPVANDTYYCVVMSLIDNAGNIGYLTDVSARDTAKHCVLPGEVVGLLSESGKCFIATAAFGSPIADEVITLRKFRDKILIPHTLGRKFVSWYYAHSPAWANEIRGSESQKQIVRTLLLPAIGFSHLALKWGALNASLFFATIILLPFLFAQYYLMRRKRETP